MKSEISLRREAMKILVENLGLVDTERFIALIKKDKFDYTEWRRDLYKDMTVDEIYQKAVEFQKIKKQIK